MVEALARGKYAFSMCNFAPPDMVGHTGIYEAAVKAVEATGLCWKVTTSVFKVVSSSLQTWQ